MTTYFLHSRHGFIDIPTTPDLHSPVIADMARLFGSEPVFETATTDCPDEWVTENAAEDVAAIYEPFDTKTTIYVDNLSNPVRNPDWAITRLYAQLSGVPLETLEFDISPSGLPSDISGTLQLSNPHQSSLVEVFDHALEHVLETDEDREAFLKVLGVANELGWLVFREIWQAAEKDCDPLGAAVILKANAYLFS